MATEELADLSRWCAALSEAPAELAADVLLAAGHHWPALAESPEQLRELTVRTYLGGQRPSWRRLLQGIARRPEAVPRPARPTPPLRRGAQQDLAQAAEAIAGLPRLERAVLVLTLTERLTRTEIAAIVDRPHSIAARAFEHGRQATGLDTHVLAATLQWLSWQPIDPVEVRRQHRRRIAERSRRRWRHRALAGAAAITACLVVAVPTVLAWRQPDQVRTRGDWVWGSQLHPFGGWVVDARSITADWEYTWLHGPANTARCWIAIGARDAIWTGTLPRVRRSVLVRGRRAALGNTENGETSNALWWQYADDSMALIQCTGLDDADRLLVNLAGRLTFRSERVLLPFRIRALPQGYEVASVTEYQSPERTSVYVTRTDYPEGILQFTISYRPADPVGAAPVVATSVRRAASCRPFGDFQVCVEARVPLDDTGAPYVEGLVGKLLDQTADDLLLASSQHDRGHWYDARHAIPAS